MNLLFSGRLQAMPAKYRTNCGRFEVIRPLIECEEHVIAGFAEHEGFPILPCNLCGSQPGLKRDAMAELLASLEERFWQRALGDVQRAQERPSVAPPRRGARRALGPSPT